MATREQENRVRDILVHLRQKGGRITSGRVRILHALVSGHRSAEELVEALPGVSRAAIYKTLDALKELGEVLEVETARGPAHYDALRPAPHAHAICTVCGGVQDLEIEGVPAIAEQAAARGLLVHAVRLDVMVTCGACGVPPPA